MGAIDGHIVLLGLMGSGKTSVGAALAARLGRPHRDSDEDIEREHGRTGREIAATDGVPRLHELEANHLLTALADPRPSVISAAASTVDDEVCVAALQDPLAYVVWLHGDPEILAERASTGDHRRDAGDVATLAARRDPVFTDLADTTIDVGVMTVDEIVASVAALVASSASIERP